MKRFLYMALSAVLLFTACKEEPTVQEEELTFSVTPSSLSFKAEDSSSKLITITTNGNWTASPAADWLHLDKNSGSGNGAVTVTVSANAEEVSRTANIQVIGKKGSKEQQFSVSVTQEESGNHTLVPSPAAFDGKKRSSTTYQLLVYSFADSDGDGVGDFNGITSKLDYLDELGVTGLWLSPIHPSDSYHGYDVTDYYAVNPKFGTEEDFKNLVKKAHEKGIQIYIDYVLNHSGKGNEWFQQALADPSSPYRDYYFFSTNPSADYSKFPMLKGTTYQSGEWKAATGGSPKLTITQTDEAVTTGNCDWNLYMWDGSGNKTVKFVNKGDGSYYLVMDIDGKWGMLVRKYLNWNNGSKFGATGGNTTITVGQTLDLVAEGGDISFTGSGRYKIELTNVSTETLYYMGCFSDWMPDLNYGDIADVVNNATFKDLAASADKWIKLGIDGFRLDAVKHIVGGISSYNHSANRKFLKAWYDHCNASFKATGGQGEIFMVGEAWDDHNSAEKYYYEGLNSCFEFGYWPVLYNAVNNGNASAYVSSVSAFILDHQTIRPDAITSIFMTNHDHSSRTGSGEVRAADDLGRDLAKEKQAAAMMLTTPGKPFIYQGEELGYWGNSKDRGDEYLRAPIVWDAAAKDCAKAGVGNKVDNTMLTGAISVESQLKEGSSLLNTYRIWSQLRNTYPAFNEGNMGQANLGGGSSIAAWYMSAPTQQLLVIHNCAGQAKTVTVNDPMTKPIALLGSATTSGKELTLGAHSSVVFEITNGKD